MFYIVSVCFSLVKPTNPLSLQTLYHVTFLLLFPRPLLIAAISYVLCNIVMFVAALLLICRYVMFSLRRKLDKTH